MNLRKHSAIVPRSLSLLSASVILLILVVACVPEVSTAPVDNVERAASIEPSLTVLPFLPTERIDESLGRSEPTSAALVGEGDANETPGLTLIAPTTQYIPIQLFATDGTLLNMTFYGASVRPANSLLLLHDSGQDGDAWIQVAPVLQAAGYNVFVTDWRGRRDDPSTANWSLATDDMQVLTAYISTMSGITTGDVAIVGIGNGANLALNVCAVSLNCIAVAAISPQPDLPGININNISPELGVRRVLLMTADDDPQSVSAADRLELAIGSSATWQRYASGGRGIDLIRANTTTLDSLLMWLMQP